MRAGHELLRRWRSTPDSGGRGVPAALDEAWRRVAGDVVAAASRPLGLNARGTLTVAVADAIWSQEIAARADELVAGLAGTAAGTDVRRLRTRVADQVFSGVVETAPRTPPPPGPAARAAARRAAESIRDPAVRAAVERAAATVLSRQNLDR